MLGALAIAFVRSPLLLLHGRVFAEEGTVYLQQAWTDTPRHTLLAVHQGYYSLLMDLLAQLTARLLQPEYWALALTTAALTVLMLTVFLAVTCEEFQTTRARLLAAGVVLLTPSLEVWLTAEDVQFYLIVCVALICLSSEHRHRLVRGLTLLLAGLTGPASCVLTPFFLFRAWRRRTGAAVLQAGVLTVCTLVQGLALLGSLRTGNRTLAGPQKLEWFGPVLFLKIFSVDFFTRGGAFVSQRIVLHHQSASVCVLFWLLALVSFALFLKMALLAGEPGLMCLWMAVASLAFDYMGIAEPLGVIFIGAFRYFFAGAALLSMVLVLACSRLERRGTLQQRQLALTLVLLVLACGVIDATGYWTRLQRLKPDWRAQVAAWRANPSTPIRVSPTTWNVGMHLPPHAR
jgi:hypothetical protein